MERRDLLKRMPLLGLLALPFSLPVVGKQIDEEIPTRVIEVWDDKTQTTYCLLGRRVNPFKGGKKPWSVIR